MRFFATSLPLVLSFLTFARASILEDHGYQKFSSGNTDAVLRPNEDGGYQLLDAISFHPWMKMATIYIANNEIEPKRQNKLDLGEIYAALAQEHNRKPNNVDWVVFEVAEDPEMDISIFEIREGRNASPGDEITIVPGHTEWDAILDTKYYMYASMVNTKAIDKVLIRTVQRTTLGITYNVNSIHFYFPPWPYRNPGDKGFVSAGATKNIDMMKWEEVWKMEWRKKWPGDLENGWRVQWCDKEHEERMLRTLFAVEQEQEDSYLVKLDAHMASANKGSSNSPASSI
ncbi:hypothetical protein CFO_g5318 [Ceratocystis platani]|uniref:Uncharacterized protein n=1 Tax=Ceratocystis fimbriata f. sp. platani TaxID=88771 RepID=A0A0F8D875_CERFI|nr:hypothetical protein CFO_g5318 [Ceratocystis platani]